MMNKKQLFYKLFNAQTELDVEQIILSNPQLGDSNNWQPLGGNKSNFSIVKNQQSNPIAALIEKITNSIDAILTKKCFEAGIDPKSEKAPSSMQEALDSFFPDNQQWAQLASFRKQQAEELQIIADGPKRQTGVIFYDNGEGQHPEKFEDTFLSLQKSNKNNIPFVQGKYNMGGTGAIVFCGKKRFQLIASKRYDGTGEFGFTIIREHLLSSQDNAKETWFEYLTLDGIIPSFPITELELGLENRKFKTGTVIKLYNYQFPTGYSAFSQDLNQSVNEYLFRPALPILTKDKKERYPLNKILINNAFGLSRRLISEEKEYLEEKFSDEFEDSLIGKLKVSCFVFKRKVKDWDAKKAKDEIRKRYFKNRMSVMFTMNGQIHGHYTTEFITRSLKMNLLKNYLLIHVECTGINYGFRKELFMASRDRLKEGEETQHLRKFLASQLGKSGSRLREIERMRKQAVNIDSSLDTKDLIKNLSKEMPLNSDLMKLLNQTFKLDQFDANAPKKEKPKPKKEKKQKDEFRFKPERFPTFLKLDKTKEGEIKTIEIPKGGEKRLTFSTDVENDYFDRLDEPGELQVTILGPEEEFEAKEGKRERKMPSGESKVLNVAKSSPDEGRIKIAIGAPEEMEVGDKKEVMVSLTGPGGPFVQNFFIKIAEKQKEKQAKEEKEDKADMVGLPELRLCYESKEEKDEGVSWDDAHAATGQIMKHSTVVCIGASDNMLEQIFINMESSVLRDFRSKNKNKNEEQIQIINKKYYTSVYFHVLFLYTITLNRKFRITNEMEEDIDVGAYLQDIFSNFYTTFILNYGSDVLLESIAE